MNSGFNLLPSQQVWAKNAALIDVVISIKHFAINEKYSITHQYDAGRTSEIYPGGTIKGIGVHGLHEYNYEKARTDFWYSRHR